MDKQKKDEAETISAYCYDKKNTVLLQAVELFADAYQDITGDYLQIPSTPAKAVDINSVFGFDIEESIGQDVVIFDLLRNNNRTLLYVNHVPGKEAIILYSAPAKKFNNNLVYEEYAQGDEEVFRKGVETALRP